MGFLPLISNSAGSQRTGTLGAKRRVKKRRESNTNPRANQLKTSQTPGSTKPVHARSVPGGFSGDGCGSHRSRLLSSHGKPGPENSVASSTNA